MYTILTYIIFAQADLSPLPKVAPDGSNLKNVLNGAFIVAGFLSVAFVAFGGLKYTLSNGDSNGISTAKNTILYALIGLAITVTAATIVNFVISVAG